MPQGALEYLKSLEKFGMQPGLERIRALLGMLGNPQIAYPCVHVAGTNGKGSTCAILHSIMLSAGVNAALFSKPHLQTYRERIRVADTLISERDLAELVALVRDLSEAVGQTGHGPPTEFEAGVAIAFEFFRRAGADIAVVETGMGGTWDATNVLEPELCAITPIGLDHTERLGSTLAEVAAQKAGIIKPGVPVVLANWPGRPREVVDAIMARASELGCPVTDVGDSFAWTLRESGWNGQSFDLCGPDGACYQSLHLSLLGEHQLGNAATAVACAQALVTKGWPLTAAAIRDGLRRATWPGRLELVSESPHVLLDGTTNPQGATALGTALERLAQWDPKPRRLHLVLGLSSDKDIETMVGPLLGHAASLTVTKAASARLGTHEPQMIADIARGMRPDLPIRVVTPASEAVTCALELAGPTGIVCICGSLYLVGEVRGIWREAE